jgi:phage shock protein C
MIPRLVRPRSERMIAGVCGGLGLYFGVDPVIMRLLFVVLALSTGLTLVLYPILWLIMPEASDAKVLPPGARFDPQTGEPLPVDPVPGQVTARLDETDTQPAAASSPRSRVLALVLVGVGALLLLDNLGSYFGFRLSSVALPVILVGLGMYLLRGSRTPMS